eukprot:3666765-Ditylum_brightwellii.AAC.1
MLESEEEKEVHHETSPAPKPVQGEVTVTDCFPSETSNTPSEDKGNKENKEDELDWKATLGYCTEE